MPPQLRAPITLDDLHDELLFTEARLEAEGLLPLGVVELAGLREEVLAAEAAQRGVRAAAVRARAKVAAADAGLDALVIDLARELLYAAGGDRSSPRFVRYFTEAPSALARLRAEKQSAAMAHWPAALAAEPEAALQALAPRAEAALAAAAEALADRRSAERARADLGLDVLGPLVDAANRLRRGVEAELEGHAVDAGLPPGWARSFFA
jgi:hypothetical protein